MTKNLIHRPLRPPRDSVPLEGALLALWQEFSAQRPDEWEFIFQDALCSIHQRAASVAASFITFMGCNAGLDLNTVACDLILRKAFLSREDAHLAAWAIANCRLRHRNQKVRAIEFILAPEYPITKSGRVDWKLVPIINR